MVAILSRGDELRVNCDDWNGSVETELQLSFRKLNIFFIQIHLSFSAFHIVDTFYIEQLKKCLYFYFHLYSFKSKEYQYMTMIMMAYCQVYSVKIQ